MLPQQDGATPVSTKVPAPMTPIASASPASPTPDYHVCIYDVFDKLLGAECRARAREARARGITRIVVAPELERLSNHRKKLCECKNIDVFANVHELPDNESEPFRETKEILENAPNYLFVSPTVSLRDRAVKNRGPYDLKSYR